MTTNKRKWEQWIGGDWSNEAQVASDFRDDSVLDYDLIIAWYEYANYEGSSYVLAYKDGKLYENEAGHCSCYGLEGTWKPGEVTAEYLAQRLEKSAAPRGIPQEVFEQTVRRLLRKQQ